MAIVGFSRPAALLLATAYLCGYSLSASGQYYYQPAPDYYRNDTAEGTVLGGALGAITGAVVAGKKDRGEGALIGAGVGALTGNLLGRNKDFTDRQVAAQDAAAVAHANRQVAAQAVTNYDLISMTQAGVSEDLMISTLRSRGARIDLSPPALISLKESGVSDRVLIAAQEISYGRAATVVTPAPPATVILAPPPRRIYHYHHHHRPCYPHTRFHYNIRF